MQKWEERQDEIDKAIEADREKRTLELIQKKQEKGKSLAQIAEDLEMTSTFNVDVSEFVEMLLKSFQLQEMSQHCE